VKDPAVNLILAHREHNKQSLREYLQAKILTSVSPYVQCPPIFLEKVCIFGKDVTQMLYTRIL